jgi:hypothetical protein
MTQADKEKRVQNIAMIGSSVGMGVGLYKAYKGKKKFWTYVGFGLLFSIIGGIATGVPARIIIKADTPTLEPTTETEIKE